jgi:hypothetical protein
MSQIKIIERIDSDYFLGYQISTNDNKKIFVKISKNECEIYGCYMSINDKFIDNNNINELIGEFILKFEIEENELSNIHIDNIIKVKINTNKFNIIFYLYHECNEYNGHKSLDYYISDLDNNIIKGKI